MTIPTNGLDFYLPFDADMDEKIHSLTGTLSSSNAAKYFMLSSDTAGNFLQCINTQGSNSYYLKYPGSESLMQYGTGDFSVSFWLRSPNWSYFMNVVFEKKYNDNQDGFVVYADGSEPVLDMRIRNQADHFTETYCNSSVFLHWCFVRVGTVGYWYCNGVLDSTTEGAVVGSASSDELFKIGYSASWPYKQAVFDLKALRIYNRALSDSEITELSKEFSGTSSLDTVLVALDGARDALVTAINAKGGSLADNATLHQCANAVGSLSGGSSAEYYKCASVSAEAATPEGATFTMQLTLKALSITSTYHWVMDDTSKTGTERTWTGTVEGDSGTHTLHFNGTYWQVVDGLGNTTATETADDPWDITIWHNADGGDVSCTFSDVSSASTGSKTWSGYKAVFDSTVGTWSFESDVTEGLAYTSVTPVVGGIYSADALVGVSSLYDKIWNNCNAYYKLDGHCRDSVNMYDGIPNNITFVDGKIGRGAHTTGYRHYISLPNEVSVKGRTQVSYSGWCFIESTLNKEFYIITEIANSSGYTRAAFGVTTNLLPFAGLRTVATGDSGSFQKVTSTSPMSTSTWYFLCGVFDLANGNITLYVNGVSVGSLNVTASSFVNANPYRIRICGFDEPGSGNIRVDEVGIWSKALSADEVSELYNNGAGKSL